MRKLLIAFILTGCCSISSMAQGEIDKQQKIFFRNERSFGLLLNTDGFGLSFRDAKRVDLLNKRYYEIEIGNLKSPREYRETNPYYQTPGTFKYGKLNSVIYIRGSYGHHRELFSKADLGGVAVRYFYSAGPSLSVYKPIYYKFLYPVSQYEFEIREEKLDISLYEHSPEFIYSKAAFTKGLNETKLLPGIYGKFGFSFEYSKVEKLIHAVEVGGTLSAFPKKIPIMATTDNKAVLFSLFVSYRFGVVIDPLNPETNKLRYIFSRKRIPSDY